MSAEKLEVEIMSQGRFSLRIPNADAPRDSAIRVIDDAENGQRTALTVRDARELRDLLLHEFPLEPNGSVNRGHIFEHETPEPQDEIYKCRSCQRLYWIGTTAPCHGPPEPSPAVAAAAEPDPDEVRQSADYYDQLHKTSGVAIDIVILVAAARAWLKLREQQPAEPAPTISQVIEACGAVGDWQFVVTPSLSGRPVARVDQWDASAGDWTKLATSGPCDTPEAAIRALYDDAVAKLQQQRDEAAAKLQKLGR